MTKADTCTEQQNEMLRVLPEEVLCVYEGKNTIWWGWTPVRIAVLQLIVGINQSNFPLSILPYQEWDRICSVSEIMLSRIVCITRVCLKMSQFCWIKVMFGFVFNSAMLQFCFLVWLSFNSHTAPDWFYGIHLPCTFLRQKISAV